MSFRLAIVGCGAVTDQLHLPGISLSETVTVTALIDSNLERAQLLADRYGIRERASSHHDLGDNVDGALVTVPNHLHEQVAVDLLNRGLHVLVEKPMGRTAAECDRMIDAADRAGRRLSVAMVRRLYPSSVFVKNLVASGALGKILEVDAAEGGPYGWPVTSEFPFRREQAGGGVLIDTGVHVLDLLTWWFGMMGIQSYNDDAEGGVEADCHAHLQMEDGTPVRVEMSRTRSLRNTYIIHGSKATLEVGAFYDPAVSIRPTGGSTVDLKGRVRPQDQRGVLKGGSPILAAFCDQVDEFAKAVYGADTHTVPGCAGRDIAALVDNCYACREPIAKSWLGAASTVQKGVAV